ncbi:MAG: hypothetical protein PWP41_1238 [Moorella sp. (in: firmicutes)]|nr:hypothetical protein [Moorella sp. (in: firmicutes)]
MQGEAIMRRITIILIIALLTVFTLPAYAAGEFKASFTIGQNFYTVNNQKIVMDAVPFVRENRTYIPVRYLANALGIDANHISWNEVSGTVTLKDATGTSSVEISMRVNHRDLTTVTQNGANNSLRAVARTETMDVAPLLINGRVYLPARYVAEALGYTVTWDPDTQTVYIMPGGVSTTPGETFPAPPDQYLNKGYIWVYDGLQYSWQVAQPRSLSNYNQSLEKTIAGWNDLSVYEQVLARENMPAEIAQFLDAVLNAPPGDLRPWIKEKLNLEYTASLARELEGMAGSGGYDRFHRAEFILSFVQSLPYIYTPLPRLAGETLIKGGDCKSKSILLASLLHNLGYQTILLEFPPEEFADNIGHEAVAIAFNRDELPPGRNLFAFDYDGRSYYYAETTATGWGLGEMPELLQNKKAAIFPLDF